MNIVFHRYGNICEEDIKESFKKLGLDIIEDDEEIKNKNIEGSKRVETISRLILENRPLFVFSINFFPYISDICDRLKVLYICWTVDSPILELYSNSIKNDYNRIFAFDYYQFESIKNLNPERIFYLPLATNIDRWNKILGQGNNNEYKYDVSFVGSLYTEKTVYNSLELTDPIKKEIDELLDDGGMVKRLSYHKHDFSSDILNALYKALIQYDPAISDRYRFDGDQTILKDYLVVERLLGMEISSRERVGIIKNISEDYHVDVFTDSKPIPCSNISFHGTVSTHNEMPLVFCGSKINLNITMKGIETGLSQRIWDVLGCRGFLMTNYQEEIPEYFTEGKDLICFESIEECKELINFYLKNDDLRQEIAYNGYRKVIERHTYDLRVSQMIKMAIS